MDPLTYTADRRRHVDKAYRRRYDLLQYKGIPTAPLPAQPTADHIRALIDLGWSYEALSRMAGTSDTALLLIANDAGRTVHRATAAAVASIPYTYSLPATVPDTCLVPATGARRRIRALLRIGWTHQAMRQNGAGETTRTSADIYHQTIAAKWRRIDTTYQRLCMKPGPSGRSIVLARQLGYAPPLAYDDIDDPNDDPTRRHRAGEDVVDMVVVRRLLAGDETPSTRAEKVEAMRRWLQDGKSERSLCAIHGWKDGRYKPRLDGAA